LNITALANQLVEPISGHVTVSLCVCIQAVVSARRVAIYRYPKADCFSVHGGPQDQVKVARMETKRDTRISSKRGSNLVIVLPVAAERPLG
jgi:hypothetical protein